MEEEVQTLGTAEDMVAEFMRVFKSSLDLRLWVKLMEEELTEYNVAVKSADRVEMLKEIADVIYVKAGFMSILGGGMGAKVIAEEEAAEWTKLLDDTAAAFRHAEAFFGEEVIWEAFKRVHISNMSKLGVDGKPIFREDGKVMKGPNYKKPYLTDLLEGSTIRKEKTA